LTVLTECVIIELPKQESGVFFMVKEIVKDTEILTQKSVSFVFGEDDYLIQDMLDTANEHKERCAGLACIQIGIPKKIVLVKQNDKYNVFINPMIIKKSLKTYIAQEGCLSVDGIHAVKRHNSVKVMWTTAQGKKKVQEFNGFIAEIIQHECDHLQGVLI
jgi:peptide deformylase